MGDFIVVNVSNSNNDVVSFEKKFPRDMKISDLKVRRHHLAVHLVTQKKWVIVVGAINRDLLSGNF